MGLDQYFFKTKNYSDIEVLYFRKYHKLDDFIKERFGTIENGGIVELDTEDLNAIIHLIIDDRDSYQFESYDDGDYNQKYYNTIGVLTHYMITQKPLYYGSDW